MRPDIVPADTVINIFDYLSIILILIVVIVVVIILWYIGNRMKDKEKEKLKKYEEGLKPKMDVVDELKEEYGIEKEDKDKEG